MRRRCRGSNVFVSGTVPGSAASDAVRRQAILRRKADSTHWNNTFIVSPSTVADLRYGFNRWPNEYHTRSDGFDPTTLGFPGSIA